MRSASTRATYQGQAHPHFFLIFPRLVRTWAAHRHFAGLFVLPTPTRSTFTVAQTEQNLVVL